METRKELQRQYADTPKRGGIFLITNTVTGRLLMGSSTNLHGPLNKHRFMLAINGHSNRALQQDWNALGESSFRLEIAESFKHRPEDPGFDLLDELALLEEIWIEKLNPFDGRGYNLDAHIRE
jgi:hypothetical protein